MNPIGSGGVGLEALTVGRVGIDLYPEQSGRPLSQVTSFAKSLGGTATNVAVGAARLGRRVGLLTKVGNDEFGAFVRRSLVDFGVTTSFVATHPDLLTPVVFCALDPAEDPVLTFYRQPIAPDLTLTDDEIPWDVIVDVPVLWLTATGVSVEPARTTQFEMLRRRGRSPGSDKHTVLDLDWRPQFWESLEQARPLYAKLLETATVAVGNRTEVEIAVGTSDPEEAAKRLLASGVEIAFVKLGAQGVLVATADHVETVPAHRIDVECGLGAGDAFGAALIHGLLAGWDPVTCARYANAAGALVASRLACAAAMPTIDELDALVLRGEHRDAPRRPMTRNGRGDAPNQQINDVQWRELLATRAGSPTTVAAAYQNRRRRVSLLSPRGNLFLVAADHPARGTLATGGDSMAMADRRLLLERLVTVLSHPDVDGVLGSPDVIEELLLLGALDDKVVIGSMNRGGLDGASWTMDDRFTGYDAQHISESGLDGGKMLLRIDDDDPATARTLETCAQAVSELGSHQLMAMIEPLPYTRHADGRLELKKDAASLARAVTIGSALGTTSAFTWLKMPSCDDPETVFAATTLPCVVLGGEPGPDPAADLASWERTLRQPTVRGLVVGRALLYPPDGDVAAAVEAAARVMRAASDTWVVGR
jgi:5-dehydro-2-deoxygluconokinase